MRGSYIRLNVRPSQPTPRHKDCGEWALWGKGKYSSHAVFGDTPERHSGGRFVAVLTREGNRNVLAEIVNELAEPRLN